LGKKIKDVKIPGKCWSGVNWKQAEEICIEVGRVYPEVAMMRKRVGGGSMDEVSQANVSGLMSDWINALSLMPACRTSLTVG
jgi:hypothetical protein